MNQIKIEIEEIPEIKIECKICSLEKCQGCNASIKKERIKNAVFVIGTGVSMVGLSVGLGAGLSFIGLGLSIGTILSLVI
jgi:hypothetical protein